MRPLALTANQPRGRATLFLPSLLFNKPLNIARYVALLTFRKGNEEGDGPCSKQQDNPHQQEGYRAGAFRCWVHSLRKETRVLPLQTGQATISTAPAHPPGSGTITWPFSQRAGQLARGAAPTTISSCNTPPTRKVIPRLDERESAIYDSHRRGENSSVRFSTGTKPTLPFPLQNLQARPELIVLPLPPQKPQVQTGAKKATPTIATNTTRTVSLTRNRRRCDCGDSSAIRPHNGSLPAPPCTWTPG